MKIIHCADIHLDSKMATHFDNDTAKKRRLEILDTFCSMIKYAVEHGVEAVIIAGDLFDTNRPSALVRNRVLSSIRENSNIQFFYLRGNHDLIRQDEEDMPENLHQFSEKWTSYHLADGITLKGVELNSETEPNIYDSLLLKEDEFNIVTLHGQESVSAAKDRAEVINLRALRNRGIDYLALGHVHAYKKEILDNRGTYCYPGCLEGRGFDECGIHGFVLLDVDPISRKYSHRFIPFARRTLYEVNIDISECMTARDIETLILNEIENGQYPDYENNLFKFNLVGAVDINCDKDMAYLKNSLERQTFFVKFKDKTEAKIYLEDYLQEESLKGAFVRSVMADDSLSEDDRNYIIRDGLRLIDGKELD